MPLLFLSCFSMKEYFEIEIKSNTRWIVQESYVLGRKNEQYNTGQKINVSAEIVDYQENPRVFDIDGKVRGYSLYVYVRYSISCPNNSVYDGVVFFEEFFTAKEPYSYKISLERARRTILGKIKNYLIGKSKDKCYNPS